MTRFLLIRHADASSGGCAHKLSGWYDAPLSRQGLDQLARIRDRRVDVAPPDLLYSSTSTRARLTAEALATAWGIDLRLERALREIHCGELEGAVIDDIKRLHSELWARNLAQNDDTFSWPGGETYIAFRRRVRQTLSALATCHHQSRVALVRHAGVINQVVGMSRCLRASEWEPFRPSPLTVTEVVWTDDAPSIACFNSRLV